MRMLALPVLTVVLVCLGCTSESAVSISSDVDPLRSGPGNAAPNTTAIETTSIDTPEAAPTGDAPESDDAQSKVTVKILDYEGIMDLVKQHKGKVVVMDAWSTFCEPCIKEFPGLVKLHKQYGPDKVACISLSFRVEMMCRIVSATVSCMA